MLTLWPKFWYHDIIIPMCTIWKISNLNCFWTLPETVKISNKVKYDPNNKYLGFERVVMASFRDKFAHFPCCATPPPAMLWLHAFSKAFDNLECKSGLCDFDTSFEIAVWHEKSNQNGQKYSLFDKPKQNHLRFEHELSLNNLIFS